MYKLIAIALVAAVSCNDLIEGPAGGGRKIYDANKEASPAIWKQKDEVTIKTNDTDVISRIVIRDLRPDKDGEVKITDGGQGQKNVTVELKSPTILRGYYFHIEVYAVKENGEEEVDTEVPLTEFETVSTEQVPVREVNTAMKEAEENVKTVDTTEHVPEEKVNTQTVVAPIISGRSTRSLHRGVMQESYEDVSDEGESDEHFNPYFDWKDSHEVKTVPTNTDSTKNGPISHVVKVVPTASTNPQEVKRVSTTVASAGSTTLASIDSPTTLASNNSTTLASTDSTTLASNGSTTLASNGSTAIASTGSTTLASSESSIPTVDTTTMLAKATESAIESKKPNHKPFRDISKELGHHVVLGIKNV